MRPRRLSLASVMLAVILVAANLAVYKLLSEGSDGSDLASAFLYSTWLMGNVLAVLAWRLATTSEARGPFVTGMLLGGTLGVLAQLGWMVARPEERTYAFNWTSQHFADYCMSRLRVPGASAPLPGGGAYFRYWPVMGLVFGMPQLGTALLGGIGGLVVSRRNRDVPKSGTPGV